MSTNFVVFQSESPTSSLVATADKLSTRQASEVDAPPDAVAVAVSAVFSPEKENVHPVTGELPRAGSSETKTKKRKPGALATKSYAPVKKKLKEPKETKSEAKKQKASTSTEIKVKKPANRKGSKNSGSSRKTSEALLPKVNEDQEAEDSASLCEAVRILQADIDSRVYELTVKPLADVTRAYDHESPVSRKTIQPALKVRT